MNNPIKEIAAHPQAAADKLAALPSVAGVSVAGVLDGRVEVGAAGVADTELGVPVTPEIRFRPGSITKLVTATAVMQCVDDGLVSLDDNVSDLVPNLRLADRELQDKVTVRHLLCHSSGIDAGDKFIDSGEGDDALERYVDMLSGTGFLFVPGTTFSYCNAGTVLAGHIAASLRSRTWDDVIKELIFERVGMESSELASGRDESAIDPSLYARGHTAGPGGLIAVPRQSDNPMSVRALAPAGSTFVTTASDLARFARDQPVSTDARREMESLQATAPGGVANMLGAGFGWMVWRNGLRVGGAYPAMSGLMAKDPASGAAIAVLTNSDQGINGIQALLDAGLEPEETGDVARDLSKYAGVYVSHAGPIEVQHTDGGLEMNAFGGALPLTLIDSQTFVSDFGPLAFALFDDEGVPQILRTRMRVWARDGFATV